MYKKITFSLFLTVFLAQYLTGSESIQTGPALLPYESELSLMKPGEVFFGENKFIEYIKGNIPLIISVPHGGYDTPGSIPERELGSNGRHDLFTQELARKIQEIFYRKSGNIPHIIINRLHRRRMDANRELFDAALDNPLAEKAWKEYQFFIEYSKKITVLNFGKGIFVDFHGHRRRNALIEVGYLLVPNQLRLSDEGLNLDTTIDASSIGALVRMNHVALGDFIRGKNGLAFLFEKRGYECLPGPRHPYPESGEYFSGGFNTEQHGSLNGGTVSSIQIELPNSVRDTEKHRSDFAEVFVQSMLEFISLYY